jgi:chromosome segregation ATPase
MSADGAAMRAASSLDGTTVRRDASSDLARTGASANQREVDVLRNSLSAVMVEYHEQSKKFASVAEDHARQSQEIARLTAQNLQLSRNLAALADAATRRATAEAEGDELRARCSELEKRLFDIESSTSWVATRRLREVLTRHPRLRRLVTTIRLALARHAT